MYQYHGFGLNIKSDIPFRELVETTFEGEPDLLIKKGTAPQALEGEGVIKRAKVEYKPSEYLLKVGDIAHYYVKDGNLAVIEAKENADEDSVRLFFLSSGMAAVLHQKKMIPLHASGVMTNDGVVLFTGESGAGKSTTITLLQREGFRVFTDDVCVIDSAKLDGGDVYTVPSYPVIKLWSNTIDDLSVDLSTENHFPLRTHLPKMGIINSDIKNEQARISKLILIKKDSSLTAPTIKQLTGVEIFKQLQKETYRRRQVDAFDVRTEHFKVVSAIAANVPVYELKRPSIGKSFDEVRELLKALINE